MKFLFALVIGEEEFESGELKQTGTIQLLFVHVGMEFQSLCFGVVFHMTRRVLVILKDRDCAGEESCSKAD